MEASNTFELKSGAKGGELQLLVRTSVRVYLFLKNQNNYLNA